MPELNEQQLAAMYAGLAKLREPFPDNLVNYLPRPTCAKAEYQALPKAKCSICGNYHATSKTVHLGYVGHAALTKRLLDVDPTWSWEWTLGVAFAVLAAGGQHQQAGRD